MEDIIRIPYYMKIVYYTDFSYRILSVSHSLSQSSRGFSFLGLSWRFPVPPMKIPGLPAWRNRSKYVWENLDVVRFLLCGLICSLLSLPITEKRHIFYSLWPWTIPSVQFGTSIKFCTSFLRCGVISPHFYSEVWFWASFHFPPQKRGKCSTPPWPWTIPSVWFDTNIKFCTSYLLCGVILSRLALPTTEKRYMLYSPNTLNNSVSLIWYRH